MLRPTRILAVVVALAWGLSPGLARAAGGKGGAAGRGIQEPVQETGFLNRSIELHGVAYRFQVYLPEEWRRDDGKEWPMILFLHGRGERGSEGMWQTQVGLPEAVRDHPERWPFVIVMPQCPQEHYWTDQISEELAMATLERETAEFRGDPERTYLTGLSLGGYGAWELARLHPHRWAAVAIAAGGVFWSYAPERWQKQATLPAEYAHAIGRTPVWLFHGTDDFIVLPKQSELMFEAFKAAGGHVRLWIYQGLKHDCWTRAYGELELPKWLLEHRLEPPPSSKPMRTVGKPQEVTAWSERLVIPLHPPAIRLTQAEAENLVGDYVDATGVIGLSIIWQGERLYGKDRYGQITELGAETPLELFFLDGSVTSRLVAHSDPEGRITAMTLRDDRHEERWEKRKTAVSGQ